MKKFYEILVSIIFLSSFQLLAQEVYSEMPFTVDNGVVKCRRIVVAFNQNVIPTTSGVTIVDTASFSIQDASVQKLLRELSFKYGYPTIRKTIPKLVWGDTLVTNKRTGIISSVPDPKHVEDKDTLLKRKEYLDGLGR